MKNFANVLLLLALAGCHGKQRALRTIPVKESVKSVKQKVNTLSSRKKKTSKIADKNSPTIPTFSSKEDIPCTPISTHDDSASEHNEGSNKDGSATEEDFIQAVDTKPISKINEDTSSESKDRSNIGVSEKLPKHDGDNISEEDRKVTHKAYPALEDTINTTLPTEQEEVASIKSGPPSPSASHSGELSVNFEEKNLEYSPPQSDELSQGSKEDELDNESAEKSSEQGNILTEHTVVSKSDSPRTVDVDGVQSKAYSKLTPVAIERFPSNREHEDNLSITHKPPDETDEELLSQHSQTSYTTETQSFKMDPKTPSETPQSFLSSYSVDTIPVPQIKPNASTLPLSLPIITKLSDKLLLKNIRPFSENHTVHLHDVEVSSSTQEPNPENQCGDPNTESKEVKAGDETSEAAVTNIDRGEYAIK